MLAADPSDGYVRRELAILNGHLSRNDLVDPDKFVLRAATGDSHGRARRFSCLQCGSGMGADPTHADLVCEHCGNREPLDTRPLERHRDVAATLWTAKGRSIPRSTMVFACTGCGAAFLVAAETLSAHCPYCMTAYVVANPESRELIEPDGIVPFAISSEQAHRALEREGADRLLSEIRGVYTPIWIFIFSGEVKWKGMQYGEATSGTCAVTEVRACVPASSRAAQKLLSSALEEFDFTAVVPYQPGQLADWPAETYQVNLETAALTARSTALPAIRAEVEMQIDANVEDVEMTFSLVAADSFRLVLVPLWLTDLERAGARVPVFVNGQSGVARVPGTATTSWFSRLFRP